MLPPTKSAASLARWLLVSLLALVPAVWVRGALAQLAPGVRDEALRQARALVEAKQYDAAIEIFRLLAERNPRDFEVQIWMARLESWKRNYPRAEALYRRILADAQANLEAELGLADVLAWQKRYAEAIHRLERLRDEQPGNLDVLLRLGRFSRWQHRRRDARRYYREVLAQDSANVEARGAMAALESERPFRVEVGYFLEEFDFTGNTNGQFIELLYRDYDRLSVLARFQYQNKFQENNTRYTLGASYRARARTWLRAELSWAPPANRVIANQDYGVELVQGLSRRVALGGGYRFLRFHDADVHVTSLLLNADLRSNLHFQLRYTPARTFLDLAAQGVWNHNGGGRIVWDASPRFHPYLLFAVGTDSFAGLSAEKLGRFAAHTYGGGLEARSRATQGFRIGYYYQRRTQARHEQGLALSYFVDF